MKKIVIFIAIVVLVLLAVAACGPSDNAVEIAQAKSVIEAAWAAQIASQGLSDVGRGQTLILVLLTLVVVLLIGMAAYVVIQRQVWMRNQFQSRNIGRWVRGPNAQWKRMDGSDPYQQLFLQQQMLLAQLLQQNQVESENDDRPQLPAGWWG